MSGQSLGLDDHFWAVPTKVFYEGQWVLNLKD